MQGLARFPQALPFLGLGPCGTHCGAREFTLGEKREPPHRQGVPVIGRQSDLGGKIDSPETSANGQERNQREFC